MNSIKVKYIAIALLFSSSCSDDENYIPERPNDMSTGFYNKYKAKLDTAYMNNDKFEIGIQLANLESSKEMVFENINQGIKNKPTNCYRIFDWYNGYQNDFLNNIVKRDTTSFLNSFNLCQKQNGIENYDQYWTRLKSEHQERIKNREKLDSTKFDYDLIEELNEIRKNDQQTRNEIAQLRIDDNYNHPLWIKQKKLDSINLNKVDSILNIGFPTKYQVGYDRVSTIWLVLHHQGDLNTRLKYMPILEKAVKDGILGEGALKTYKWRTNNIKLKKQDELQP